MNETLSMTYSKDGPFTSCTCFVFDEDAKALKVKVTYSGKNAEELIRIMTEQDYLEEHDRAIRESLNETYVDITSRLCKHIAYLYEHSTSIDKEIAEAGIEEMEWISNAI